jgi:hypothetical protein
MVRIRICIKQSDPDPYQIENQDPDQIERQDPDPDRYQLLIIQWVAKVLLAAKVLRAGISDLDYALKS